MPRYKWKNKDTFPTLTDTNIPHLNDGGSGSGDGDTGLSLMSTGDEDSPKYRSLVSDADPLTASKKESGNWIDIDGDNIPYAIERNPGRVHEDRFDGIPWIESMRRFEREFNDTDDEDKQRIYDKTFNPYVRYQGTPIVDDLKVEGTYDPSPYVGTGADVTIKVYDPAGIEQIYLSSEQESKTVDIDPSDVNNDGVIKKKVHLNTDTWDWVSGWDLDIEVSGVYGNTFEKNRDIDSVLDSIWDSLSKVADYVGDFAEWIWKKATGVASEAADAAAELASAFVDWAKGEITSKLSSYIDPILDEIESYVENIVNYLHNSHENGEEVKKREFLDLFYSDVFDAVLALSSALMAASYLVQGVSFGASSLVGVMVPLIVSYLVNQMFSEHAPYDKGEYSIGAEMEVDDLFNYLEDLIKDKIEGQDESTNLKSSSGDGTETILVVFEVVIGAFGLPFSVGILADAVTDKSGVMQATVGLVGVILSMFFTITAFCYKNKNDPEPQEGNMASVISVVLGGIGLLFSSWAGRKPGGQTLANKVSSFFGLAAILIGILNLGV